MSAPHVLVLQHAAREGPGAVAEALEARGIEARLVRIDRGEAVPVAVQGAAGLLVLGGPMGVYEVDRFPHLGDELRLIERALGAGLPVLGICLGSQLVAAALGARVYASGELEIGWGEVELGREAAADPLLAGEGPILPALHWHGDIFELPPGAIALASSRRTAIQAFRHGESAHGLLFHIEIDRAAVEAMVGGFPEELEAAGVSPSAMLEGLDGRVAEVRIAARRIFGRWAERVAIRARGAAPSDP